MKKDDEAKRYESSRRAKRGRLDGGIAHVLARGGDAAARWASDETTFALVDHFVRDHQLTRALATRYAECVRAALEGFPDGQVPPDVLESHVDALARHDEAYARRLFHSDDLVVRALRGTAQCVRRVYRWLDEGDRFTLAGRRFRAGVVTSEKAGAVDEAAARREGMTLAEWRRHWLDNLPRSVATDVFSPDQGCLRHEFVPDDDLT